MIRASINKIKDKWTWIVGFAFGIGIAMVLNFTDVLNSGFIVIPQSAFDRGQVGLQVIIVILFIGLPIGGVYMGRIIERKRIVD